MGALTTKSPANTYKDLLTVNSAGFDNQGLEVSLKQVVDGEGVASPLYLGTVESKILGDLTIGSTSLGADLVCHGTDTDNSLKYTASTGDLQVSKGAIITKEVRISNDTTTGVSLFTLVGDTVNVSQDLLTKGSVTFQDGALSGSQIVIYAENGAMSKGAGKGNVQLTDTEVKLKKGDDELLTLKSDGTMKLISAASTPTATAGGIYFNGTNLFLGTSE
jgi:hypothetical protein